MLSIVNDAKPKRKGLELDRVVLLGRTFEEYERYFGLDVQAWRGRRVLDVASGVSSFTCEANERGLEGVACDPIYELPANTIRPRCEADLDHIIASIDGLEVYRWAFYQNPTRLRTFRERAYRTFLQDYERRGSARYHAGALPRLPFADQQFDLTLVSYLLFVYQDQLDYAFHRAAVQELVRVTKGEVRIYPLITFDGERSIHIDRMRSDPEFAALSFEEVETDFEFLVGSNWYLRITRCSTGEAATT